MTYLFQGLGHHVVKVGVSAEFTTYDHLKGHSGGTNVIESAQGQLSDAEHFGVLLGPDNPSFLEPFHIVTKSTAIAGGFIQDSWSILDKVTVNAGIRYDIQLMQAADGQVGLTMPNEWAPRIGVIYDPTQEGRAKLFANFARYYENIPLGLADGSLSGEPSVLATYSGCNPGSLSKLRIASRARTAASATPSSDLPLPTRRRSAGERSAPARSRSTPTSSRPPRTRSSRAVSTSSSRTLASASPTTTGGSTTGSRT